MPNDQEELVGWSATFFNPDNASEAFVHELKFAKLCRDAYEGESVCEDILSIHLSDCRAVHLR